MNEHEPEDRKVWNVQNARVGLWIDGAFVPVDVDDTLKVGTLRLGDVTVINVTVLYVQPIEYHDPYPEPSE